MDEYDFEKLIADLWEKQGWKTSVTTGSTDRGIDVVAEKSGPFYQKQLIQVKRYSGGNKIGSPEIQQYSSLKHQESNVDAVIIVATSAFTSQARRTAEDLNVKLIDADTLLDLIQEKNAKELVQQYGDLQTSKTDFDPKNTKADVQSLKRAAEEIKSGPNRTDQEKSSKSDQLFLKWIKKLLRM